MAKIYSTPGVYIEEQSAFTNSVVPVATAVPCFIGFTEKATRNYESLTDSLVKIASFDEFNRYFGGAPQVKYTVNFSEAGVPDGITPKVETQYYLYYSMKLYFNNGGGDCYVFSTGGYGGEKLNADMVEKALKQLEKEPEPTMIVVPDGHTMEVASDYYGLWKPITEHCKSMINRFAILDIHGGGKPENLVEPANIQKLHEEFKNGVTGNQLAYGAVYWPWVQASVVQPSDVDFRNIDNLTDVVVPKIKEEIAIMFPQIKGVDDPRMLKMNELIDNLGKPAPAAEGEEAATTISAADISRQHNALWQTSPLYKSIMMRLRDVANVLPPSGAMAGVYKTVDASIGTHQAPANVGLSSVVKTLVNINDHEQETLNIPIDGKAINAIRAFPGKGILVWGARTMDGNSQDWRYISVRRTVSMIELSIKYAAEAFVFEPNVSSTWSNLKAMITNFLTNMWYAGALAGASPDASFNVEVGLGNTMTPVDILDGYMRISVKIAVTRPAEFIVITFEQQMQNS